MKISDAWLQNAQPHNTRYDVTVTNRKGLVVRVHETGSISFRLRYKRAGNAHVMVLGEYGRQGLSLKDAFDMHDAARSELARGLDPIEEREKRQQAKEQIRQDRAESGTVADIVEQFVHRKLRAERWDEETHQWVRERKLAGKGDKAKLIKVRPRKRPEIAEALLKANLVDAKLDGRVVGNIKARDLTRRQLVRLLDAIVDRGAPVLANRVYALVKQCFNFAASKDLISASPVAGIERPGGDEQPRDRVLTSDEVRLLWEKLGSKEIAMSTPTRLALKLLLVTAQRRGEITHAKWEHVDLDEAVWTIPGALSKNGKAHKLPLSSIALRLLRSLKSLSGKHEYVLPSQHTKRKPTASYSERVLSRAVRNNEKELGIAHFTPHDLRRTAASMMTSIGVPRLHVEKVLNHTTSDIAEVYDRHDYFNEKRVALGRWADHLTEIIEIRARKVVPLKQASGV